MDNCIAAKNTVNRLYILLFKHQTTVVSKYQNQPWSNCINFISLTFNVIRYQYNTAFFNIYLHYLNFSYTNKLCAILLHLFDPLLALYCNYRQWTLFIDYLYYSYVQNFQASEKFPIVVSALSERALLLYLLTHISSRSGKDRSSGWLN